MGFMLYYVFLFSMKMNAANQNAWALTFLISVLMDFLLISTIMVLIMEVLIPSAISKDVNKLKRKIMDEFDNSNELKVKFKEASEEFNAANFFFVSVRLAKIHEDLSISKLILNYSTPFPRQLYNASHHHGIWKALVVSLDYLTFSFLSIILRLPRHPIEAVIEMSCNALFGYIVLLHVTLFDIYPGLIVLPSFFLFMNIVSIYYISQFKSKIKAIQSYNFEKQRKEKLLAKRIEKSISFVEEFRGEDEVQNDKISIVIVANSNSGPNKEEKSVSKEETEWNRIELQEGTVSDTDPSAALISYPPKLEKIESRNKIVDLNFEPEDFPVMELRNKSIEEDKEEEPIDSSDNKNILESVHNNNSIQYKVPFAELDDLLGKQR